MQTAAFAIERIIVRGEVGEHRADARRRFCFSYVLQQRLQIVQMPKPFQLPAEGRDIYRNFVLSVKVPAGKYVKAVEYRPGNPREDPYRIFR